jgi:hypothetical protein
VAGFLNQLCNTVANETTIFLEAKPHFRRDASLAPNNE